MREEPGDVLAHERWTRAEVAIGGVVGAREQPRVDQQLDARCPHTLGARALCNQRGESAARRVAADPDPLRVPAELARALEREAVHRPRVLLRRGEAVLRAPAIVDRQHRAARARREHAAEAVAPVELADHEAALVEIEHERARTVEIRRHVQPSGERAVRSRYAVLFAALERAQRRRRGRERLARDGARLRRRERVQCGNARSARDQRDVRVERAPANHCRRTRDPHGRQAWKGGVVDTVTCRAIAPADRSTD